MSVITDTVLEQLREARRIRTRFEADRSRNGRRARYLAHNDGYVMARHPRCIPFVLTAKEWDALPFYNSDGSSPK